jgi:methylmalonyl-CoA mutase N-terminal domain/subunit
VSSRERKPEFNTSWGEPRRRLYGPADVPADGVAAESPGQYPFTRGVHEAGYRSRLWTMRQYAGFGSAAETNKRYRFLLDQGQTGLSVAFDLPTQMGHDPDAPIALGEVGKVGVSIAALEDMADLFEGIPLDRVSTSRPASTAACT